MFGKTKTLGLALGNLAKATVRLTWGLAAGPLGRCHFCGRRQVKIEFPEGCRYWAVDLTAEDDRNVSFCPHCERALLENAQHIVRTHSDEGSNDNGR